MTKCHVCNGRGRLAWLMSAFGFPQPQAITDEMDANPDLKKVDCHMCGGSGIKPAVDGEAPAGTLAIQEQSGTGK